MVMVECGERHGESGEGGVGGLHRPDKGGDPSRMDLWLGVEFPLTQELRERAVEPPVVPLEGKSLLPFVSVVFIRRLQLLPRVLLNRDDLDLDGLAFVDPCDEDRSLADTSPDGSVPGVRETVCADERERAGEQARDLAPDAGEARSEPEAPGRRGDVGCDVGIAGDVMAEWREATEWCRSDGATDGALEDASDLAADGGEASCDPCAADCRDLDEATDLAACSSTDLGVCSEERFSGLQITNVLGHNH